MDVRFRLFPESASLFAERVDVLFVFIVSVVAFFTLLICALILYFGVRYRRGATVNRSNPPNSTRLELIWGAIPLALSLVMFVWGADIFFEERSPPAKALRIDVVAKQWMWKIQHRSGKAEINALHVPVGQPVRLKMISEDVIHSFYVPAFRVKQDVLPGRYTELWFQPTKTGSFRLFCAEYCGTEHAQMKGTVVVMEQDDFANWLSGETGERPEIAGARLFERFRCPSCHKPDGTGTGPVLTGLFGQQVPLTGGGTVVADDQYLHDAIVEPSKQIVAGFQPLMPAYRNQLDEALVLKLIAYLKSQKRTP